MKKTHKDPSRRATRFTQPLVRRVSMATAIVGALATAAIAFSVIDTPASAQTPAAAVSAATSATGASAGSTAADPGHAVASDAAQIAHGAYLARAADCIACHTAHDGPAFGGGYPIATPFGTVYGSNISSDKQYGIGSWTDQQFLDAVRHGKSPNGNLYPAMPYDSFVQMRPADVLAIKAYLMSLPPVHTPTPPLGIKFPFNQRWTLWFWAQLNARGDAMTDDPKHDAEWNRGRYLTEALEHCEACHTPRNITLGMDHSRAFGGGDLGGWTAFNISSDKANGVGAWSDAELAQYLSTGDAPGRGTAAGPMGEAVEHSLQYLKPEDIHAIVSYLRTVPPVTGPATTPRTEFGKPSTDYAILRGADAETIAQHQGAELFLANCATCHAANGAGKGTGDGAYPSMFHHSTLGAASSKNLVSVILDGIDRKMADGEVFMPAFNRDLSDADIATLANYLTKQFGNPVAVTTAADVAKLRTSGLKPHAKSDSKS